MIDTPTDGRELLEALKDVEDHFIRTYDSSLEVSCDLHMLAVVLCVYIHIYIYIYMVKLEEIS